MDERLSYSTAGFPSDGRIEKAITEASRGILQFDIPNQKIGLLARNIPNGWERFWASSVKYLGRPFLGKHGFSAEGFYVFYRHAVTFGNDRANATSIYNDWVRRIQSAIDQLAFEVYSQFFQSAIQTGEYGEEIETDLEVPLNMRSLYGQQAKDGKLQIELNNSIPKDTFGRIVADITLTTNQREYEVSNAIRINTPPLVNNLQGIPSTRTIDLFWDNPNRSDITSITIFLKSLDARDTDIDRSVGETETLNKPTQGGDNPSQPIINEAEPNVISFDADASNRWQITGLIDGAKYIFSITLNTTRGDNNAGVSQSVNRTIGPNLDGDLFADSEDAQYNVPAAVNYTNTISSRFNMNIPVPEDLGDNEILTNIKVALRSTCLNDISIRSGLISIKDYDIANNVNPQQLQHTL